MAGRSFAVLIGGTARCTSIRYFHFFVSLHEGCKLTSGVYSLSWIFAVKSILSKPSHFVAVLSLVCANFTHAENVPGAGETPVVMTSAPAIASIPAAPQEKIRILLDTRTAAEQRYPNEQLNIVEKIHTQMNVGMVLLGLLAQTVIIPHSKENIGGTKIPDVPHPAGNMVIPGLRLALNEWFLKPDVYSGPFDNALYVRPDRMALVYVDFADDNPTFDFYLQTTVSRKPDSTGFISFSPIPQVTCYDKYSDTGLSLDQWKADHYAQVDKRVRQHVESCLKKVSAEFSRLLGA